MTRISSRLKEELTRKLPNRFPRLSRSSWESSGTVPELSRISSVIIPEVMRTDIILTNIDSVPGKTVVEHFGLVQGATIRAKHIGTDTLAALKNIVGGELKGYTKLLQESRQEATERMVEQAKELGANAVINVRFATSSVAKGAAELFAYGTAVRVE